MNVLYRFWWGLFDCRKAVRCLSFGADTSRRLKSLVRRPVHAAAKPVVGAHVTSSKNLEWLSTAYQGMY